MTCLVWSIGDSNAPTSRNKWLPWNSETKGKEDTPSLPLNGVLIGTPLRHPFSKGVIPPPPSFRETFDSIKKAELGGLLGEKDVSGRDLREEKPGLHSDKKRN